MEEQCRRVCVFGEYLLPFRSECNVFPPTSCLETLKSKLYLIFHVGVKVGLLPMGGTRVECVQKRSARENFWIREEELGGREKPHDEAIM
jgi:hypothetical protein